MTGKIRIRKVEDEHTAIAVSYFGDDKGDAEHLGAVLKTISETEVFPAKPQPGMDGVYVLKVNRPRRNSDGRLTREEVLDVLAQDQYVTLDHLKPSPPPEKPERPAN
jgi:hypothetical protein